MKRKNHSNQLARECIVTALIQLARQKEFSAITISELTARAGVSRMTYYRNYHSKEEVFRTYMDEIVEIYCEDVYHSKIPENYGEYQNILHCFRYFEKYADFISCLIHVGMGYLLLEALSSHLLTTYCGSSDNSVCLHYSLLAYAGALFNVYIAWLESGSKESVEFLTDILYHQLHGGICTDYMPQE